MVPSILLTDLIFPHVLLDIFFHADGWKSLKQSLIAVLGLKMLLVGVEKCSLLQCPKANCRMLLSLDFEEATPYQIHIQSIVH
jgi:hypothetical protein